MVRRIGCIPVVKSKSFQAPAIPTSLNALCACTFMYLGMARRMQGGTIDEVARNGALLRINFGQRFS